MFSFQLLCFSGFDFFKFIPWTSEPLIFALITVCIYGVLLLAPGFPSVSSSCVFPFFCSYSCSRILTFLLWLLFISCSTLIVYRLLCFAFNFSSSTHLYYSCLSSTTHTLVCFLFYLTFLVLCWSVPASAFLQLPLELHKIWAIKVLWSSLWQQLWATYSAIQSRGTFPSSSNSPLTPWLMLP